MRPAGKKKDSVGRQAKSYRLHAQIGYRLRVVNQIGVELFADLVGKLGGSSLITTAQFAALSTLWEKSSLTQTELARLTSMDMPTLNGVLKRLVARGLVEVTVAAEDKRIKGVSLTKVGRSLTGRLRAKAHLVSEGVLKPLKSAEQKQLLDLLQKLIVAHRAAGKQEGSGQRQGTRRRRPGTISID